MERKNFQHATIKFSYLDNNGDGQAIIALHAMWMQAISYEKVAERFGPGFHFLALDQRGHGHSGRAEDYSIEAYVEDLHAFLKHLKISTPVILMGNSLGGTIAFMFAAKYPALVKSMIIEESPVEEKSDMTFMLEWEGFFPNRQALEKKIGPRLAWSLIPSMIKEDKGWTLSFDMKDMMKISESLNGNWWNEWLKTKCPVLLFRGTDSKAVEGKILKEMAEKRANTKYVEIAAGHVVHEDNLGGFYNSVSEFLKN